MKTFLTIAACALVCAAPSMLSARDLDVAGANVKKQEIRHGQIGPRDTVIFYTFGKMSNPPAILSPARRRAEPPKSRYSAARSKPRRRAALLELRSDRPKPNEGAKP